MGLSKKFINHTKVGAENLQPLHMVRSKYFLDSPVEGVVKNLRKQVLMKLVFANAGYEEKKLLQCKTIKLLGNDGVGIVVIDHIVVANIVALVLRKKRQCKMKLKVSSIQGRRRWLLGRSSGYSRLFYTG
jgi:hypothetical protein